MTVRAPRGGVLFEMIVAMAIFIVAAAVTLSATRDVLGALDRSAREQEALDLARSLLAELEAGLINLEDLRQGEVDAVGSERERADSTAPPRPGGSRWTVEVETTRSEYANLTLVELTVTEETAGGFGGPDPAAASATLRQLVRLRGEDAEAWEQDELLEGLPAPREEPRS